MLETALFNGIFDNSMFKLLDQVSRKKDLTETSEWEKTLKSFLTDDDYLCQEIVVHQQTYKKGDLLVLAVEDCDQMAIGVLQTVVVRKDKVYFLTRNGRATRNFLRIFITDCVSQVSSFVESSKLFDYKPLINKGTSECYVFLLHHISYDYA